MTDLEKVLKSKGINDINITVMLDETIAEKHTDITVGLKQNDGDTVFVKCKVVGLNEQYQNLTRVIKLIKKMHGYHGSSTAKYDLQPLELVEFSEKERKRMKLFENEDVRILEDVIQYIVHPSPVYVLQKHKKKPFKGFLDFVKFW